MYKETRIFNEIKSHPQQLDSQKNLQNINFNHKTQINFKKMQRGFPLPRKNQFNKVLNLYNASLSLERSSQKSFQFQRGKRPINRVSKDKRCDVKLSKSLNQLSQSLLKLKVLQENMKAMRKQFTRNSDNKILRRVVRKGLDNIEETTEEQQTLIIPVEEDVEFRKVISCDSDRKNPKISFDYYLLGFKQAKMKPKYQKSKSKSKNRYKNQKSARDHFNDYGY